MNAPLARIIYEFGDFQLDPLQRQLRSRDGRRIPLTGRMFETLLYLVEHAGQVLDKTTLMQAIWPKVVVEEGSLTQVIYEIRRALGEPRDEHRFIVTVPGTGYCFVADVTTRERTSEWPAAHRSAFLPTPRGAYVGIAFSLPVVALVIWFGVASWTEDEVLRAPAAGETVASVAVLPFQDLSPQHDQQYFSDGLSEELINLLSQNPSLRVIARTSSFSFRGREFDLATIANKLGVSHLLEGSVRKIDNRVRVAVQLIDAGTSALAWSQSFDRDVDDVLRIQREIAAAVATTVKATLAAPAPARVAAVDPVAYERFLEGYFTFNRRQPGDLKRAEVAYLRALERDPGLARAWAGLAGVYAVAAASDAAQVGLSRDAALEQQRDAAERALALDPSLADAHVRRAWYRVMTGDRAGAHQEFELAAKLDPNNPLILGVSAGKALLRGRPAEAVEIQRRAVARDPLSLVARENLAAYLWYAGRFEDLRAELQPVLQLAGPPVTSSHVENGPLGLANWYARSLMAEGRFAEALVMIESWPEGPVRDLDLALAYYGLGYEAKARAALQRSLKTAGSELPILVAEVYAFCGDTEQAFKWLNAARQQGGRAGDDFWKADLRHSPFFAPVRRDPRWETWLLEKG